MHSVTQLKSIYTLTRPDWLDAAGMSKGINHDHQHLGIILGANQTLRVRQVDAAFSSTLTLRLLNDGRKTEASYNVGRDWVEASVNAASVPFIKTPYVKGAPVVEFEYPETSKILPVYRKGENEAAFFERWNSQDAEFAIVDSGYAQILVPKVSKPALQASGNVGSIDALITYYEGIFSFYNALCGLSFEAEHDSDWNIANRYLMKADKDDSNAGYYNGDWTAESSASVSRFWLTPQASNWGSLHEIAHGYQGHFMTGKHFSAGEVWNNIYAASYQDMMLGERKYQDGWLYDYGNKAKVEETIFQLIAKGKPLNQWDLRSKLYFLMLMVDKAGKNAFMYFNQQYRKSCNTSDFTPYVHSLLDLLSESFAVAGAQVDVTPFIQLTGGDITQPQRDRNKFSHAKAVYPLYQLVDKPQLEAVKNQLKLDSTLRLVDATQLKATGLTGNVSLRFNIDNFAQIYGKDLILLEGARYAYKISIDSPTMTLRELPIGVYTLRLPTGKDRKYQPTTDYLKVKQGDNVAEITFVRKLASPVISQEINFLGMSDEVFATLLVDRAQGKLIIDVFTTTPHNYFPGVTYAKIVVRDPQGTITFTKEIPGTEATLSHDELIFSVGDQIEIFHKEPARLRVNPPYPDIIDSKNLTNVLTIAERGLINADLQGDPGQALLTRLDNAALGLRGFYQAYHAAYSPFKDDIYLAIQAFDSPEREQLLVTYKDCLPADNTPPSDNVGNKFMFIGAGFNDRQFLGGILDLVKKTLTIKISAGIPHSYFSSVYASIAYEDVDGNSLYREEVIGNQNQQARSVVLPLSGYGGEVIRLFHEEPDDRLIITNEMQHVRLAEMGKQQHYRITTVGLERIDI